MQTKLLINGSLVLGEGESESVLDPATGKPNQCGSVRPTACRAATGDRKPRRSRAQALRVTVIQEQHHGFPLMDSWLALPVCWAS